MKSSFYSVWYWHTSEIFYLSRKKWFYPLLHRYWPFVRLLGPIGFMQIETKNTLGLFMSAQCNVHCAHSKKRKQILCTKIKIRNSRIHIKWGTFGVDFQFLLLFQLWNLSQDYFHWPYTYDKMRRKKIKRFFQVHVHLSNVSAE